MALAFSNLTSGNSITNGASTASVTKAAGSLLLLTSVVTVPSTLGGDEPTLTIGDPSSRGITWTRIHGTIYSDRRDVEVWKGTGGSGSGAFTLTYSAPLNGGYQSHAWSIEEVTGQDTTTPNDAGVVGSTVTGTSLNLPDVGTPDGGDRVFAAFGFENGADSFALEAALTELGSQVGLGNVRSLKTGYDASDPQDETPGATWGTSGNTCGGVGFIVNAAAGGGSKVPIMMAHNS